MIKVIEHGNCYDEHVKVTCDWCKCVFEADMSDLEWDFDDPNHSHIKCPECNYPLIISVFR